MQQHARLLLDLQSSLRVGKTFPERFHEPIPHGHGKDLEVTVLDLMGYLRDRYETRGTLR